MTRVRLLLAASALFLAEAARAADPPKKAEPERLKLWNQRAPQGDGTFEKAEAVITVHRPEKPNGTAAVICPGGGYGGLVTGAEGHGIADWLNKHGVVGVVLEYRLPKGGRSFLFSTPSGRSGRCGRTPRRGGSIRRRSASSGSRPVVTWPRPPARTSTTATRRRRTL